MWQPATIITLLSATLATCHADLPVHCLKEQIAGVWEFQLSQPVDYNRHVATCGHQRPDDPTSNEKNMYRLLSSSVSNTLVVELTQDGSAVVCRKDNTCTPGTWTMIYDEGLRLSFDQTMIVLFFRYYMQHGTLAVEHDATDLSNFKSICTQTLPGWWVQNKARSSGQPFESTVGSSGCSVARKVSGMSNDISSTNVMLQAQIASREAQLRGSSLSKTVKRFNSLSTKSTTLFQPNKELIRMVNLDPVRTWFANETATFHFQQFKTRSKLFGSSKFKNHKQMRSSRHSPDDVSQNSACLIEHLPRELDYSVIMDPIRSQGQCGSCYAVASADAISARYRLYAVTLRHDTGIKLPNFQVSSQDIIDCSAVNQGCDGGYSFLVGFKGLLDGFVRDHCKPYSGEIQDCSEETNDFRTEVAKEICSQRLYLHSFGYVGGKPGSTDDAAIMQELFENGPLAVAINAPESLLYYQGGVYNDHTKAVAESTEVLSGWEKSNHALVLVGWGVTDDSIPYWKLKNSWGPQWGENGYLRLERGHDELAVSSMPVQFKFQERPLRHVPGLETCSETGS